MTLEVASINSGSNGNCYYIGHGSEAVLIDAGLSCRETVKRMNSMGLDIAKVKALFVSHEHTDHIKGVEVLSRRYNIPVFISSRTHASSGLRLREDLFAPMDAEQHYAAGSFSVKAFKKHHDAADPFSFNVYWQNLVVGVYTDLGHACSNVVKHFRECHAVFLETNYDEDLLDKGLYPYHLKQRIKGNKGHLSNTQALELFVNHRAPHLSHVFLSHLSQDNNHPQLAIDLFKKHAGHTEVHLAPRYSESGVFKIRGDFQQALANGQVFSAAKPGSAQTSLF